MVDSILDVCQNLIVMEVVVEHRLPFLSINPLVVDLEQDEAQVEQVLEWAVLVVGLRQ